MCFGLGPRVFANVTPRACARIAIESLGPRNETYEVTPRACARIAIASLDPRNHTYEVTPRACARIAINTTKQYFPCGKVTPRVRWLYPHFSTEQICVDLVSSFLR